MKTQTIPMEEKRDNSSKLFNFRPVFFSAVFFVLGIVLARVFVEYALPAWLWCLCIPVAGLPFCFVTSKREAIQRGIAVTVMSLFFLLGIGGFVWQIRDFQDARGYFGEYTVHGRVANRVDSGTFSWLEIDNLRIDGTKENGKLIAYLPTDSVLNIQLADKVVLLGNVDTDTALFDEDGFRSYALENNAPYIMRVKNAVVEGHAFHFFLDVRQKALDVVREGMDNTPAEIFVALLLGETSGIDKGLLENVRYGGIAHVFAVSGLHVGALFGCLLFIMKRKPFYRIPKPVRFCIMGAVLLFYGGICSFSSSVIRATVMCLCYYASSLLGIESDGLENVGGSCIIATLISPCSVFGAGYQLSFTACLGILLLGRRLEEGIWLLWGKCRALAGIPVRKYLPHEQTHPLTVLQTMESKSISFLSVTLSAQIFTAPIQILAFGYLSVWSLLLNCIFVPLIGALFPLLLAVVSVTVLLPVGVSFVLLYIPNLLLSLLALLFSLADFTAVAITNIHLTLFSTLAYYFALLLCTDKWNAPKKYLYITATVLALSCVIGICI